MALVSCHECKHQVSNTAAACPQCGAPVAEASESKAAGVPFTTIQETSKKLKLNIIFSSILFWISLVWMFAINSAADQNVEPSVIPSFLVFVGIVWYLATRFRIWWHHK